MNQQQPSEQGIIDNIKSGINDIGQTIQSTGENISAQFGDLGANVRSVADKSSSSFNDGVDIIKSALPPTPVPSNGISFSLSDYATLSSEFMESNSYIARAAFILLVVFTFFVLLRLATGLIKFFIGRTADPTKVVDGMRDGTVSTVYTQGGVGSTTIYRSSNERTGIEFTWAVSLYITDQSSSKDYLHIFNKGSIPSKNVKPNKTVNQSPGMYLDQSNGKNDLIITMDSFNQTATNKITIPSIPHNKWMNVIVRCKNTLIDVYINGQVAQSIKLPGVPKQNYGNIYVSAQGGFNGQMSNLFYYQYALSINEIQTLLTDSVSLQLASGTSGYNLTTTDYLGFSWYNN